MPFIKGRDTIRGTDGSVMWKINGEEFEFIHFTQITVNMEIAQDEVPRIGTRTLGHKTNTVTISGSGTGYYGEPRVRRAMMEYLRGGAYPDMQVIITNKDPDTQAVTQTFLGTGLMVTNLVLAELDASTSMLEEDIDFTLESCVIKDEFNETKGEVDDSVMEYGSLQM